jgi:hypothetical protein
MAAKYIAGPFFLAKPSDRLPEGAITVSHCLAEIAPDTWAIEWVSATDEERAESAARCGISNTLITEAIAWTTDHFERGFAWSHVFLERAVALEFSERFLSKDFRLLQIGLPERFLRSFLALAAPPPQQAGYAPNGSSGVYQALLKEDTLPAGHSLGFEVLGYDRYGGGFDSYRCNAFEQPFAELGAVFNPAGLIDDESMALRCAELANSPEIGTCADAWHPWLIVEPSE